MRRQRGPDDWVRDYRERLGLAGFPEGRDVWRLTALLQEEGWLEVEVGPVGHAYHYRDGPRCVVTLPEGWGEEPLAQYLLHELGHALCDRATAQGITAGAARLYRQNEAQDEAAAQAFVLCWLLPLDLMVMAFGNEDLLDAAPASREQIAARWAMLR